MRGKVSIVIPCYNKEKYIGATLDSVAAQEWDNIELILVNDGSDDGTRGVIAEREPMLRKRGYSVIIADQENAGACAAAKAGLDRAQGDYLCLIDADDELAPGYVGTMAGWLEEHAEYDYCGCDYLSCFYENGVKKSHPFMPRHWPADSYTPDFFLCNEPSKAVWSFMSRMSYIRKCHLLETFYTGTRGSYEPSFMIPFTVYGGKMKRFAMPLYYHNDDVGGLSQGKTFAKKEVYWREYHRVILLMLGRMPEDVLGPYRRKYLASLSSFYTLKQLFLSSRMTRDGEKMTERLRLELLSFINNWISPEPHVTYDEICEYPNYVCMAAELALNGLWNDSYAPKGRIIGYGAMGAAASNMLPLFSGTPWQPTELWDISGDGSVIKKPNFHTLSDEDILMVFTAKREIVAEIQERIGGSGVRVLYRGDVDNLAAAIMFPQFERVRLINGAGFGNG